MEALGQDTMKRHKFWIVGIKEENQKKGTKNIFNKVREDGPNLEKKIPTLVQETYTIPTKQDQKTIPLLHIIIKKLKTENKKGIENWKRERPSHLSSQFLQNKNWFFNRTF